MEAIKAGLLVFIICVSMVVWLQLGITLAERIRTWRKEYERREQADRDIRAMVSEFHERMRRPEPVVIRGERHIIKKGERVDSVTLAQEPSLMLFSECGYSSVQTAQIAGVLGVEPTRAKGHTVVMVLEERVYTREQLALVVECFDKLRLALDAHQSEAGHD
jgi:hypothetical protein